MLIYDILQILIYCVKFMKCHVRSFCIKYIILHGKKWFLIIKVSKICFLIHLFLVMTFTMMRKYLKIFPVKYKIVCFV